MAAQFSQTTRSLAGDRSRYAWIAWGCALALLGLWIGWFALGSVTVYQVSSRARLEARRAAHPVAAPVGRKVVASALTIGAMVHQGDVLVSLDDSSERLRLREAQTRLAAIPREIAALEREIAARDREKAADLQSAEAAADVAVHRRQEADAAADGANDYERRARALGAEGLMSTLDVTRAVTDARKLAAARNSLASDLSRIQFDARTRAGQHDAAIEDLRHSIATLDGELTTARASIAVLQAEIDKHVIRAPISGRVGDVVPVHAGSYVAEGQKLATIVPDGDLIVVADFDPRLAFGRIHAGQRARVRLDGFPWAQYGTVPAEVTRVASEIRDDAVRVELTVARDASNAVPMQHGLTGSVEVGVEQASPAVLVLRAAGLLLTSEARP